MVTKRNASKYLNALCNCFVKDLFVIFSFHFARPFNTEGALQMAKNNVERDYAVVGSWEDINVTLTVLEAYIPRFFSGATKLYYGNWSKFFPVDDFQEY